MLRKKSMVFALACVYFSCTMCAIYAMGSISNPWKKKSSATPADTSAPASTPATPVTSAPQTSPTGTPANTPTSTPVVAPVVAPVGAPASIPAPAVPASTPASVPVAAAPIATTVVAPPIVAAGAGVDDVSQSVVSAPATPAGVPALAPASDAQAVYSVPTVTPTKTEITGSAMDEKAGFSTVDYLSNIKDCKPGTIEAGVDSVTIKGMDKQRCHVVYSIAGRTIDCRFTAAQLRQIASTERLSHARDFDRGVGMVLSPLSTDDPNSPLATCKQY